MQVIVNNYFSSNFLQKFAQFACGFSELYWFLPHVPN